MQSMKGNRRPQATMRQPQTELLPSARIRCQAGRIQVGSHTYQSASDALSAYMQQFDSKQSGGIGSGRSVTGVRDPLDSLTRKNAWSGRSSAIHLKCDPANVTGLLTGPEDVNGVASDSLVSIGSPRIPNGIRPAPKSSKHSVSFALPDSVDNSLGHSTLSGTFGVSGSSLSQSPQQRSASLYGKKFQSSVNSHGIAPNSSSDTIEHTQCGMTAVIPSRYSGNATEDVLGHSLSTSNGVVDSGHPALSSKLIHNGLLLKDNKLQLHTSPRSEGAGKQQAKSAVEMLLTEAPSQSDLNSLGQASAGEGKLRSLLQETSVPESSSTSSDKSALQQEVEEALNRSAQLLETIKTDVLVSPRSASDVGSLSTDVLLSIDPQNPTERLSAAVGQGSGRESRSRHRYSYHTATRQPRSVSVGPLLGAREQRTVHRAGRRRSVDSFESSGLEKLAFLDLTDSVSALSDSESMLKHLQTAGGGRSLSRERNPRAAGKAPSWIHELIPPTASGPRNGKDLTDSLFSQRDASGGRKAPSWVSGLEQSDIASSVGTQDLQEAAETLAGANRLHGAERVKKAFEAAIRADESVASELSYAGPGLNYSDLASSPALNKNSGGLGGQLRSKPSVKVSRTNSFGGIGSSSSNLNVRKVADRSKPPVTMSRIFQDLAGVDTTGPQAFSSVPDLSSSLGADSSASVLRRKVCEDSRDQQHSLDKYLSQVAVEEDKGVGKARRVEPLRDLPRCSSMNMGNSEEDQPSVPSNVTGASSITKDSNFSSKLCLDDPTLTPARQSRAVASGGKRAVGADHRGLDNDSGADLLDGDRPWESMLTSFKAPVYVEDCSPANAPAGKGGSETPTLSGGQQPGSMEALKQMLFRLQCEESSTSTPSPPPPTAAAAQDSGESGLVPALRGYDFEVEPGGQSLERALVHLGRLKTLVQAGTAPPSALEQTSS